MRGNKYLHWCVHEAEPAGLLAPGPGGQAGPQSPRNLSHALVSTGHFDGLQLLHEDQVLLYPGHALPAGQPGSGR